MHADRHRWLERALRRQSLFAGCGLAAWVTLAAFGLHVGLGLQTGVLLAGVVLVGFPHGAFDHLVARPVLRPRLGRFWWVLFGIAYVGLAALVWLAWIAAPLTTLALFLAGSVLHFGLGDREEGADCGDGVRLASLLTNGALPILLPVALHAPEAAPLLAAIGGVSQSAMQSVLSGSIWLVPLWLAAFVRVCWASRRQPASVMVRAITACSFVVLPPLLAFGLYFALIHAPRHLIRLGAWHDPRDPRRAARWSARIIVPASVACAVAIGGLALGTQEFGVALLASLFRLIAALTLPHMIVTAWLEPHPARDGAAMGL